ncbi:MAG: chorismate mutase [Defluviitaleaceae bacterium]|nr:chorismate mutase [Defluviitaleaceae bacterium]
MSLDKLRDDIDRIDHELITLFKERMDVVSQIADYKKANHFPTLDKSREEAKVLALAKKLPDELSTYIYPLYDTLFEISRNYQHLHKTDHSPLYHEITQAIEQTPKMLKENPVVACQGIEGAYSGLASKKLFKHPDVQYFNTFEGVFSAIENGFCEYGVLPLENSTAGSVNAVYRLLQVHDFKIVKSMRLKIDHNLAVKNGVKQADIKEIISHPQALAQCAALIEKIGTAVKITPCENTALAAKLVATSERNDLAAICSTHSVARYGLDCLKRDVQDQSNNYTRFICMAKNLEIYPGADKTSIMAVLPHQPGALYKVLARFHALGINLQKLESRPMPDKDFQFKFYFDLETSIYSKEFAILMDSLDEICQEFKYLGSYLEVV